MATVFLDPNGDGSPLTLSPSPSATHYINISHPSERQPTAPAASAANFENAFACSSPTDTVDEYLMETISGVGTVTDVKIWTWFSSTGGDCFASVNIYMAGAYVGQVNLTGYTNAWTGTNFSGSWTQSDLDNMKVKIGMGSDFGTPLNNVYAEVTYTASASGPANLKTLNTIDASNLKTFNTIDTSNIKSIMSIT